MRGSWSAAPATAVAGVRLPAVSLRGVLCRTRCRAGRRASPSPWVTTACAPRGSSLPCAGRTPSTGTQGRGSLPCSGWRPEGSRQSLVPPFPVTAGETRPHGTSSGRSSAAAPSASRVTVRGGERQSEFAGAHAGRTVGVVVAAANAASARGTPPRTLGHRAPPVLPSLSRAVSPFGPVVRAQAHRTCPARVNAAGPDWGLPTSRTGQLVFTGWPFAISVPLPPLVRGVFGHLSAG